MNTELVGPASVRVQQQVSGAVCIFPYDFVFGMRLLTLLEIDLLTRSFIIIRRQWQIDAAWLVILKSGLCLEVQKQPLTFCEALLLRPGGNPCHVGFADGMLFKLLSEADCCI